MTQKKISKAQIKRNRKAWLEALRSGKFKQTKGKLRSRNGAYCCLGVACEVLEVPRVWDSREYQYGTEEVLDLMKDEYIEPSKWNDYSSTSLPRVAAALLGVDQHEVRLAKPVTFTHKGEECSEDNLIELNDTYGWSFAQIADAIEKNGLREVE